MQRGYGRGVSNPVANVGDPLAARVRELLAIDPASDAETAALVRGG